MSISQKVQRLGLLGSVKTLISIETNGLQQNGVRILSPVFESVSTAFSEGTIHLLHLVAKKTVIGWWKQFKEAVKSLPWELKRYYLKEY